MKGKFEMKGGELPPLGIVCYIFGSGHSVRMVLFHLPGSYGAVQIF